MVNPTREGNGILWGNKGIVKIDRVNSVKTEVRSGEFGGRGVEFVAVAARGVEG